MRDLLIEYINLNVNCVFVVENDHLLHNNELRRKKRMIENNYGHFRSTTASC